jgi:hypothetical protein
MSRQASVVEISDDDDDEPGKSKTAEEQRGMFINMLHH